jgi:hypothetical protein
MHAAQGQSEHYEEHLIHNQERCHRRCRCRRQVRPPYQCGALPPPRSILLNQDKALSKLVTDRTFCSAELFGQTSTVRFGPNDRTFFCRTQNFFFTIFDPYPPTVRSFLLLSIGKFGKFLTPPPLRNADVLNGWSLIVLYYCAARPKSCWKHLEVELELAQLFVIHFHFRTM